MPSCIPKEMKIPRGTSINYVTPEGREGFWPRNIRPFSLIKVNQTFFYLLHGQGVGGQKLPILVLHNLWTVPRGL